MWLFIPRIVADSLYSGSGGSGYRISVGICAVSTSTSPTRPTKEDSCKGRFWEGRFKSLALPEEIALLACMAYLDLNPIRAGLSETLEGSDYTSIQERIEAYRQTREDRPETDAPIPLSLIWVPYTRPHCA